MSEQWHSDAYLRIMSERHRKEKIKHIVKNVAIGGVLAFATAVTIKNACTPMPETIVKPVEVPQNVTYNNITNYICSLPPYHSGRGSQYIDTSGCSSWKESYLTAKKQMVDDGYPDWDISMPLLKIAMAEAESESTETKAQVMRTVLNRVWSDDFPDTIDEVIFDKGEFTPVSNGRYSKVEPDDDCWHALYMVNIEGWDKSQGALYFETPPKDGSSTWHSRTLYKLFESGNLTFYTDKEADHEDET